MGGKLQLVSSSGLHRAIEATLQLSAVVIERCFCCVVGRSILIDAYALPIILCQVQAPKLKTDVHEMESFLKQRCDAAAVGDYTLWNTGPKAALDMLRVSPFRDAASVVSASF